LLPLAKNAAKRLKSIRHPDVLKFVDYVETETAVYIVTERIQPLRSVLESNVEMSPSEREAWLIWGLHRITVRINGNPYLF
jgi:SCY1-like protein 1